MFMNAGLSRLQRSKVMFTHHKLVAAAAGLLFVLSLSSTSPVQAEDSLAEALKESQAHLNFRYRYEYVDQESFLENANASTLRTRGNIRTGNLYGFSFFGELDVVVPVVGNDYNAGAGNTPDKIEYPVVADPTGIDINQAYVQWNDDKGLLMRGGRERIIYDNARFVGNVGWRQNEQTYDGVYAQKKVGGFDFQGAWVGQVNRIFGHDVPAGTNTNNTWLMNGSKDWGGPGKLVAYYYDIDNKDVASFSTVSYGVRYTGSHKTEKLTWGYAAEFAHQVDAHNNPVDYSANYYRVDLSLKISGFTPYVGYGSLGGSDTQLDASFRTPLATLHAFNGWADKFLATPAAGLDDLFVGVKGKIQKWSWNVVYHDFNAESGSASYGKEFDASIGRKFAEHYGLLIKGAWFNGDDSSVYDDTTKIWVQFTANF
jgi:hypothetical protein